MNENFKQLQTVKQSPFLFTMATTILLTLGTNTLSQPDKVAEEKDRYQSNCAKNPLVTTAFYCAAVDLAAQMAELVSKQAVSTADLLRFLATDTGSIAEQEEEYSCPVCGEELEFSGTQSVDYEGGPDEAEASWTCPHCGAQGTARYDVIFKEHTEVVDCDGTPIIK